MISYIYTSTKRIYKFMNYSELILAVKSYVQQYLNNNRQDNLCFHDLHHISDVVAAVEEMADYYKLTEEDHFILVCAAYFHDIGYLSGGAIDHENRSVEIASSFLADKAITDEVREKIKNCILATRMPQNPSSLLEEIIGDADLFHLGGADFDARNKLMYDEAERVNGAHIRKSAWRETTISFLKAHQYHTQYAQQKLDAGKREHLNALIEKQRLSEEKDEKKDDENKFVKKEKGNKKERDESKRPDRGIETMFRITSANNQRLSDMADNKANILLTVNSIILSMVVAVLVRKLDNNGHLIIPTILLMTTVVVTMVFAILSTIPKIPQGRFKKEDVEDKSVNLLFFGNFYRMNLPDYKFGMEAVMKDSEFLYGMLIKDVYSQGVVLGRKYKLLRYAYGVFMFGLILSVIAYIFSVIIIQS